MKKSSTAGRSSAKKAPAKKSAVSSEKPIRVSVDNNSSVNVREIENGFIVSESGYTGKGKNQQWYNKDYYSKSNPLGGAAPKIKFGK